MTCRFCAYSLDEAVELRRRLMQKAAAEQGELDAELKAIHEKTNAQPVERGF